MKIEQHEWIDVGTGTWLIEKDLDSYEHIRVTGPGVDADTLKTVLADEILRLRRELEIARRAFGMIGWYAPAAAQAEGE